MEYPCECYGFCSKTFPMSMSVVVGMQKLGHIAIANTCLVGPSRGDVMIAEGDGYKVYVPVDGR